MTNKMMAIKNRQVAMARAARDHSRTVASIAEEFGVSHQSVCRTAIRAGDRRRERKRKEQEK